MAEQSDIEFRISKTGHLVPIVDQVFMHSIYDPINEAEIFVESHLSEIENNSNHLILGLGFGYHVFKVLEKLKAIHGPHVQVVVIEANIKLVDRFLHYAKDKNINVEFSVFTGDVQSIYNNDVVLNFLLKRPQVLVHRASFQKDKSYYQTLLQYNADQSIESYWSLLRPGLKEYLSDVLVSNVTIEEIVNQSSEGKTLAKQDFFFQFINAIKQTSPEKLN